MAAGAKDVLEEWESCLKIAVLVRRGGLSLDLWISNVSG